MPRDSRVVYPIKPKPRSKPFSKKAVLVFGLSVLVAVVFIGLLYAVRTPYLRVEQVEISGTRFLPASEIEQAVRNDLSGFFWFIIPRNNFFFVSDRRISGDVLRMFPQLSGVEIDKKFPKKIAVTVKERQLWGVYCFRSPTAVSVPCFYLDSRGTAYEEFSRFEGWLLPLVYGPEAPKLGEAAISAEKLEFFGEAKAALESAGGRLLSMSLSTTTPDDVRLGVSEGWEVWITATRPVTEWLSVLKTLLASEVGEKRFGLEYVDLRFGNKVFYKYR